MATKTDFTPEAWQAIIAAPTAIGQLVITASFGVGDVIKEAKALSQQMNALVQQPGDLPLLVALAADFKQKLDAEAERVKSHKPYYTETPEKQDPAVQKAQLLAGLQAAIAAVDANGVHRDDHSAQAGCQGTGGNEVDTPNQ